MWCIVWCYWHSVCARCYSLAKATHFCNIHSENQTRFQSVKPPSSSSSFQDPVKTVEETVARKGPEVPRNSEQKIITTAADLTSILPPPPPPIPPRPAARSPPLPPRLPSFTEYFSMQSGGGGGFGTKAWAGEKDGTEGRTEGERGRHGGERTEWQYRVRKGSEWKSWCYGLKTEGTAKKKFGWKKKKSHHKSESLNGPSSPVNGNNPNGQGEMAVR